MHRQPTKEQREDQPNRDGKASRKHRIAKQTVEASQSTHKIDIQKAAGDSQPTSRKTTKLTAEA
jgi:hypothetical protein